MTQPGSKWGKIQESRLELCCRQIWLARGQIRIARKRTAFCWILARGGCIVMRLLWGCLVLTGVLVDAQVRFQASACGICVGQSSAGTGFFYQCLGFLAYHSTSAVHSRSYVTDITWSQHLAVSLSNILKKRLFQEEDIGRHVQGQNWTVLYRKYLVERLRQKWWCWGESCCGEELLIWKGQKYSMVRNCWFEKDRSIVWWGTADLKRTEV
jgi:hypothetical protein